MDCVIDLFHSFQLYDNDNSNPGVMVPPPMYSTHHSNTCYPQYFPSYVPPVSFLNLFRIAVSVSEKIFR